MSSAGAAVYSISNRRLETKTEELDKEFGYEEIEDMYVDVPPPPANRVEVSMSQERNSRGNPILDVDVYVNNMLISNFKALSGRTNTQNLDRNVANNASPSPTGSYIILPETQGFHPETGGVFLPYEPTFETQRSELGFHIDPSWGKDNGEDGTVGCLGFKTLEEYNNFVKLIEDNGIYNLDINY